MWFTEGYIQVKCIALLDRMPTPVADCDRTTCSSSNHMTAISDIEYTQKLSTQ